MMEMKGKRKRKKRKIQQGKEEKNQGGNKEQFGKIKMK